MADVTITNTKLAALNAFQASTLNAATETVAATAQKFIYTPTGKDSHIVFSFVTASADVMTVTIKGGVGPFALGDTAVTTPAAIGTHVIQIETGRFMQANGTIEMSVKPAAGKALKTDNALTVSAIELIPN